MKLALKPENLARLVFFIRGEKVMLDADLAALYGVWPKALNQAVKRNKCKISCRFLFSTYGKGMGGFKVGTSGTIAQAPGNQAPAQNWSQFVTSSMRYRGAAQRRQLPSNFRPGVRS